jgi:hypothetical protein
MKADIRGHAAGRTVDASPEAPQYLVESEKSGGTAVHKSQALTKKPKALTKKPKNRLGTRTLARHRGVTAGRTPQGRR